LVITHLNQTSGVSAIWAITNESLLRFWVNSDIILMNTGRLVGIGAAATGMEDGLEVRPVPMGR
jgi:hypothetical protein